MSLGFEKLVLKPQLSAYWLPAQVARPLCLFSLWSVTHSRSLGQAETWHTAGAQGRRAKFLSQRSLAGPGMSRLGFLRLHWGI